MVMLVSVAFTNAGLLGEEGNCVRYGIDLISKFGSTLGSATRNAADHTAWPLMDLAWHVYRPLSESASSKEKLSLWSIANRI